jgi:hypothetical protein
MAHRALVEAGWPSLAQVPAEVTVQSVGLPSSRNMSRRSATAMGERQEFPVQTKRRVGMMESSDVSLP